MAAKNMHRVNEALVQQNNQLFNKGAQLKWIKGSSKSHWLASIDESWCPARAETLSRPGEINLVIDIKS